MLNIDSMTISIHNITAAYSKLGIFEGDLLLESVQQIFENFKCLFLVTIKHIFGVKLLFMMICDHFQV